MRKRKGMRKYLKRLQLKISPIWKRKQSIKSKRHRVPYRVSPRRNTPRHILIKLTKTKYKERILKSAREKQQVTYKGNPIRLTADLSAGTLQARREWQDIFKVLKGKNLQPRLLYPARISFKIDGETKSFSDKQKLRLQYHQTRFTTNVKRTYIVKKHKRRKKIYKINPKQLRKWQQEHIYINNYCKCKWIKCSYQKTQTGLMDTKQDPYICCLQ